MVCLPYMQQGTMWVIPTNSVLKSKHFSCQADRHSVDTPAQQLGYLFSNEWLSHRSSCSPINNRNSITPVALMLGRCQSEGLWVIPYVNESNLLRAALTTSLLKGKTPTRCHLRMFQVSRLNQTKHVTHPHFTVNLLTWYWVCKINPQIWICNFGFCKHKYCSRSKLACFFVFVFSTTIPSKRITLQCKTHSHHEIIWAPTAVISSKAAFGRFSQCCIFLCGCCCFLVFFLQCHRLIFEENSLFSQFYFPQSLFHFDSYEVTSLEMHPLHSV